MSGKKINKTLDFLLKRTEILLTREKIINLSKYPLALYEGLRERYLRI